ARTLREGPGPRPPTTSHFVPRRRNSRICWKNSQRDPPYRPLDARKGL
ncbi:MAG: hypothetical protein AVDCRST_MAG14-1761, partial [uncultured Rubrobacteraceae bacterium]